MTETTVGPNNARLVFKDRPAHAKKVNRLRKAGKISDREHYRRTKRYDVATDSNVPIEASPR